MNLTPQDTMLMEAGMAPEDLYCGDPNCDGYYDKDDLTTCACDNQVCQDCRKTCDCCGEAIGCVNCLTNDDEGEDVCDECLKKCETCGYTAMYKRLTKVGDIWLCSDC